MFKRSWLSVRRKFSRSLVLVLVLFAMANLVLAGLSIKSATQASMDYAKSSLGGEVSLSADMEKLRGNMSSEETPSESDSSDSSTQTRPTFTRPTISKELADSVADSDYVKDYTYSISSSANLPDGLEVVETTSQSQSGPSGMMAGGPDSDSSQTTGDMTIQGVNSYAFISYVENDEMEISSGTYFDENSGTGVMVSYDFAEANSLSVDDTIKLTNTSTSTTTEVKIIGIYDVNSDNFNSNTIYTNIDTAAKFLSDEDYNDGDYSVSNVTYYMNDAANADAFVAEMEEKYPEITENNLKLGINDTAHQQMVEPIEQVGSFANIILWAVVIASILIISLIVVLNVKDRRYEIGVLMSLGASKLNIAGQILTELLIVGTIGFILSIGTSGMIASTLGDNLLKSQLESSQQQSEESFGRPGANVGGGGSQNRQPGQTGGENSSQSQDTQTISEIDVNQSISDYATVFALGYAVIFLSVIAGSINILKLKPKAILAGKD